MAPWHYDRLSAQDNSFLLMERGNVRMHVASTNICDMGALRSESGGIDIELVKRATMSIIHLVPRYRQRLFEIPVFNHAVWVDDAHFDIDYHIRHTSLPHISIQGRTTSGQFRDVALFKEAKLIPVSVLWSRRCAARCIPF